MKDQTHLLKSRKFLPLFITQFLGAFNDNAFKNGFLIWFTFDAAQKLNLNPQIIVSVASGLFILPFFLFSALAGQVADKFEKSKIIHLIKIAEIAIMALSFVGFHFQNVALLLLLVFLMGLHSTFFGPIKYSLLPQHLKNDELISGNALIESGTFLAILLGTIFGGLVIRSKFGIEITCMTVLSLAIIGLIASQFIPKSPIDDPRLKISFNIFTQTKKIIELARFQKIIWHSIMGISWFWLIGITFLSQFPIYTKNTIGGNELIVTMFLSIFSVGIGLGSVMCNKLLKGKINLSLLPLGSFGISAGIFIFCLASYFYQKPFISDFGTADLIGIKQFFAAGICSWLIAIGLLMIAIFAGIFIVPLYAIMQHKSEEKYVSRVIAANNFFNATFMVFASILLVLLIKMNFDLLQIFLLLGIANILVFFVINRRKAN